MPTRLTRTIHASTRALAQRRRHMLSVSYRESGWCSGFVRRCVPRLSEPKPRISSRSASALEGVRMILLWGLDAGDTPMS